MRLAALLLAAAALAGCGSHRAQSPEQVARAWSADLNRSDDKAAGAVCAQHAHGGANRTTLLVIFARGRPGYTCEGRGGTAAAVFPVCDGKITLCHQVPPPKAGQTV